LAAASAPWGDLDLAAGRGRGLLAQAVPSPGLAQQPLPRSRPQPLPGRAGPAGRSGDSLGACGCRPCSKPDV